MTLAVKAVDADKPHEKAYKLKDAYGLYLYVSPKGAKSWRANYTEAGKQKTRTCGLYPVVSLAEARKAHLAGREEAPALKVARWSRYARPAGWVSSISSSRYLCGSAAGRCSTSKSASDACLCIR